MLRDTDTWQPTIIPDVMGTLCHVMYQESRKKLEGTYAWDFGKLLGMFDENAKSYKASFQKMFDTFYNTVDEAQNASDEISKSFTKKNLGIGIISRYSKKNVPVNYNFESLCPVKVRDYKAHKNCYALYFKFTNSNNESVYIKMSEKYDLIETFDDLTIIENFNSIYENDEAVSGYDLYAKHLEDFRKISLKKKSWKPADIKKENARRIAIIKDIPNIENVLNTYSSAITRNELVLPTWYDMPEYYLPTNEIYGKTTIGEWNKIVNLLTVDKDGRRISPDESLLGCGVAISLTDHNHRNTYINKEINSIDENTEIWLNAVGWKRYTPFGGCFLPDGENKKRWQPQLYLVDMKNEYPEWTVEAQININKIDIKRHQYEKDPRCTFIDEVKDAEWWVKKMYELDKYTYDLVWHDQKDWGKQRRR